MTFANSNAFWLMTALPVLALFFAASLGAKRRALERFGSRELMVRLSSSASLTKQYIKMALFLGALFTTLELPPDAAEADHCGTCTACLDICPTAAFPAPYRLDARRCISYLTIEHKGPIARELRPHIGNRIYGCDDCLAVCPWNKFAKAGREAKLAARPELDAPSLAALAQLDDTAFRRMFAGTAVKRTGRDRFVRNVLIAIGNSGDPALAAHAERLIEDRAGVVRGAAVWAAARLIPREAFAALAATHAPAESDDTVRDEWAAAMEQVST